jgi:hypothetical protein
MAQWTQGMCSTLVSLFLPPTGCLSFGISLRPVAPFGFGADACRHGRDRTPSWLRRRLTPRRWLAVRGAVCFTFRTLRPTGRAACLAAWIFPENSWLRVSGAAVAAPIRVFRSCAQPWKPCLTWPFSHAVQINVLSFASTMPIASRSSSSIFSKNSMLLRQFCIVERQVLADPGLQQAIIR